MLSSGNSPCSNWSIQKVILLLTYFFAKSAKLNDFAVLCEGWLDKRACKPVLRFLARFLLVAFAVSFLGASASSALFFPGSDGFVALRR